MSDFYGGENPGGEDPNKKKPGMGKKFLLILLAIVLVSGVVGGGVYYVTQMIEPEDGWASLFTSEEDTSSLIVKDTENTTEEASSSESQTAAETVPVTGETQIAQVESADVVAASGSTGGVVIVDVSDVVDSTLPSIVAITNTIVYENYKNYYGFYSKPDDTYEVTGSGSGIILGDNGSELWIVTNNHVIEDATSLTITFNNGLTAEAYVKGTDEDNDVAVVGVSLASLSDETKSSIRAIAIGDSDSLRMGEGVIAIGNALGFGQSVTAGCISALNRVMQTTDGSTMTLIQTDAAINPGNSGGALLDRDGRLIGINVAKLSDSDVEGMGFAIPISQVRDIIDELSLIKGIGGDDKVSEEDYPYLGVQLKDISENMVTNYGMPAGILVYYVEENSPAQVAGIMNNDVITSFDGHTVRTYEDLNQLLPYYAGGTTVTLTVSRMEQGSYQEQTVEVTLGFRADHTS